MTKRALLIGINYIGSSCSLAGCWNDVDRLIDYLHQHGYLQSNITVLTDEPNTIYERPTASNIRTAIAQFIAEASPGDHLWFSYSGHGGNVRDRNGDELDGQDECIYGCDLKPIIDDELRASLCDSLPSKCTLRCVLDCCHSGSGLDLPWRYLPSGVKIQENKKALNRDIIMISGCTDSTTSADTYMDGGASGALTGFLLRILNSVCVRSMRWQDLIQVLQHELRVNGYSQVPQLSLAALELRKKILDI